MSSTNGEWKVTQAEFRGFVKAKLEDMTDTMKAVVKQTEKNTKDIAKAKGWAAGISAVVALVVSILHKLGLFK